MTLDTRIRILDPVDVTELFRFCQAMLGPIEEQRCEHGKFGDHLAWKNAPGQGLSAWLILTYGADGSMSWDVYDSDDEEYLVQRRAWGEPETYVAEVSFDTAYGYRGPGGLGAGELHAGYVARIGRWCEERGLRYSWQNEFTANWFTDWRNAAEELGDGSQEAMTWFHEVAKPVIEAEYPEVRWE